MLVGVLINYGLRSAFWTYKGNSPQLKINYMAKLTVPTGRPRCGIRYEASTICMYRWACLRMYAGYCIRLHQHASPSCMLDAVDMWKTALITDGV